MICNIMQLAKHVTLTWPQVTLIIDLKSRNLQGDKISGESTYSENVAFLGAMGAKRQGDIVTTLLVVSVVQNAVDERGLIAETYRQ